MGMPSAVTGLDHRIFIFIDVETTPARPSLGIHGIG
jgi:hypothetical protein